MTLSEIEQHVRTSPHAIVLGHGDEEQDRRANAFRFVNTVAKELRDRGADVYVLSKPGGANVGGYAADILCVGSNGHHYDVVSGSEDANASVTWGDAGPMDPARFRLPDPAWLLGGDPPQPPIPPIPPTEPVDLAPVLERIDDLEVSLTSAMAEVHAAVMLALERINSVSVDLAALKLEGEVAIKYLPTGRVSLKRV